MTALDRDREIRRVSTSDDAQRDYDYVALALGHLSAQPTSKENRRLMTAKDVDFLYVPTGDATVRTAAKLADKQHVFLLGQGLTLFDYLELLTTWLGGRYVRTEDGLRYEPSGTEPHLYVSSRRGVPYHARGVNEKAPDERWEPKFLTLDYTEQLRRRRETGPVSFGRDVWPAVVREVELAYTLAQANRTLRESDDRGGPCSADGGPRGLPAVAAECGSTGCGLPVGSRARTSDQHRWCRDHRAVPAADDRLSAA